MATTALEPIMLLKVFGFAGWKGLNSNDDCCLLLGYDQE